MRGCDRSDGLKTKLLGELIGIVVVQVRNTPGFLRAAAILADIMQNRRT